MFRYGISCALEPQSQKQPVILRGKIEMLAKEVREIGYDAIELFIRNPKQYNGETLLRAAENEGLQYAAIATGMEYNLNGLSLISDDEAIRKQAVDRLKEHIELGAQLKCPVIAGIMRGNIPDFEQYKRYEARLTQALSILSDYAAQMQVELVVESILRYINNYLNSAPETAAYLRALNRKNIKLHIDTHSMLLEDKNLAESIHLTKDILGYVHFSDSNRCYPGAGNIDFKSVMRALMEIGYQGYITVECLPYPTQILCAQRGLAYMKAMETILSIEKETAEGDKNI